MLGPMTNSLSGVRIFVKAILDARPWRKDPLCIRKEWSEREYALGDHGGRGGKLCFAIMWDNEVIKPHPPLLRALEMTKKALEAAGHTGTCLRAEQSGVTHGFRALTRCGSAPVAVVVPVDVSGYAVNNADRTLLPRTRARNSDRLGKPSTPRDLQERRSYHHFYLPSSHPLHTRHLRPPYPRSYSFLPLRRSHTFPSPPSPALLTHSSPR